MTNEEIIELARECGLLIDAESPHFDNRYFAVPLIERFARAIYRKGVESVAETRCIQGRQPYNKPGTWKFERYELTGSVVVMEPDGTETLIQLERLPVALVEMIGRLVEFATSTRDRALEEAAEKCYSQANEFDSNHEHLFADGARECAEAIRSMKGE